MLVARYPTKKALRDSIGKRFNYQETSYFGPEFRPNAWNTVVGPSAYKRKWYANVFVSDCLKVLKVQ